MPTYDQRLASAESRQTPDGNFCKLENLNSMQKRSPSTPLVRLALNAKRLSVLRRSLDLRRVVSSRGTVLCTPPPNVEQTTWMFYKSPHYSRGPQERVCY